MAESWTHRLTAYPRAGGKERVIVEELQRLSRPARCAAMTATIWMAFFGLRTQLTEFVLRERAFCDEMMQTVPPELWIGPALDGRFNYREPTQIGRIKKLGIQKPWAPARSYGLVVRLDRRRRGDREPAQPRRRPDPWRHRGASGRRSRPRRVQGPQLSRRIAACARREGAMTAMIRGARRTGAAAPDRQRQQGLRRPPRDQWSQFRAARRRDPCAARRERRGQIDALQGDRRRDHAHVGRLSDRGPQGLVRVAQGGARRRRRHGLPGIEPRSVDDGRAESRTGHGEAGSPSTARSTSPRRSRCSR